MIDPTNEGRSSRRLSGLFVGVLSVLAAGAATVDENRQRFLEMSAIARRDLAESLRRFDQDFRPQQQQAIRAIDDRLKALPAEERESYFAASRRFHNWIKGLPERVRDDLLAKPPDQRMATVKALVSKYPLPALEARSPVDFLETGGTGLFEVASLCKTWLALAPAERRKIDSLPPGGRRGALHEAGRDKKIPRELTPPDYDEKRWVGQAESRLEEIRAGAENKDWVAKLENRIQAAAIRKGNGKEPMRPFLHRLAVNLYVQEHESPPRVDPDRLSRFFAAIPSWVQSTFNAFPADEARRRLTLVYRLVYPHPQEFGSRAGAGADPATKATAPVAGKPDSGSPAPVPSKAAAPKSPTPSSSPF
jgi:hypothetical protein